MMMRRDVRRKYGIEGKLRGPLCIAWWLMEVFVGAGWKDFATSCCCPCCALAQMNTEMKHRAAEVNSGTATYTVQPQMVYQPTPTRPEAVFQPAQPLIVR